MYSSLIKHDSGLTHSQTGRCYLARHTAPLEVCDLPEKMLCVRLLLLVLPALFLQLLELQVLEAF